MECLSDGDGFTARELAERGFRVQRIAELLAVEEWLVEAALLLGRGEAGVAPQPAPVAEPVRPPRRRPAADEEVWPPPVNESTEWTTVRVPSRRWGVSAQEVRVRWVMLWGQRVRINAANEVWCHACLRFHATEKLGHPFNGCPVGLPHRGGIVRVEDTALDDEPRHLPVSGRHGVIDFLREPM